MRLEAVEAKIDCEKFLSKLSPRHRKALCLRFGIGGPAMILRDVGKELDVSSEWVRRMICLDIRRMSSWRRYARV